MAVDASKNDLLIGVVGAGAMGRGIVQVAAAGGIQVKVFDIDKDQLKLWKNFFFMFVIKILK